MADTAITLQPSTVLTTEDCEVSAILNEVNDLEQIELRLDEIIEDITAAEK